MRPVDPSSSGERPVAALEPRPEASALDRLARRLVLPFALGVLSCLVLALVADIDKLRGQLLGFEPWLLLPVLGLSLINYALRFWRWQVYLGTLRVSLPWWRSLQVFLVGLVLSVTPGKAGELGKAWLVRELGGGPARHVVPVVFAERITDLLSVVILVSLGALGLPGGGWFGLAGIALSAAGVALLCWSRAALWLLAGMAAWPVVGRRVPLLTEMVRQGVTLLRPRLLALSLVVGALAWAAEGVGFVVVVRAHGVQCGLLTGIFDYSVATLVGGLSMLPGGLLASEGALAALLETRGAQLAAAASATLITRAATLWFAVALGLVTLPSVARQIRRRQSR
jgi:uncharacterized membrane protein YbhN (UPF0104 family)